MNKNFFGGAENNINQKFNYNYNASNEQQALESVNSEYIKGDENKFGRGDNRRLLEVNPAGEGPTRLAKGLGIRVKNLTNNSRNEFLSKPRKYKRRSKTRKFKNLPPALIEKIFANTEVGNPSRFARSHKVNNPSKYFNNYEINRASNAFTRKANATKMKNIHSKGLEWLEEQKIRNIHSKKANKKNAGTWAGIYHGDGMHNRARIAEASAKRLGFEINNLYKDLPQEIKHKISLLKQKINRLHADILKKQRQIVSSYETSNEYKELLDNKGRVSDWSKYNEIQSRIRNEIDNKLQEERANLLQTQHDLDNFDQELKEMAH